jgi:hypothetical protein
VEGCASTSRQRGKERQAAHPLKENTMTDPVPALQSFANHRRLPPWAYTVSFAILAINIVVCLVEVIRIPSFTTAWALVVGFALVAVAYYARLNALVVQDRVIKLEMRLRLARVLPNDQQSTIDQLTKGQLVGLRFASDAELPALVQATLRESLSNVEIKKRVSQWQADWQRV